jgi:hypothetical protein
MNDASPPRRKYRWPWFVLAAFILAVVLAVLWMRQEIAGIKQRKRLLDKYPTPAAHTNVLPATNSTPSASDSTNTSNPPGSNQ